MLHHTTPHCCGGLSARLLDRCVPHLSNGGRLVARVLFRPGLGSGWEEVALRGGEEDPQRAQVPHLGPAPARPLGRVLQVVLHRQPGRQHARVLAGVLAVQEESVPEAAVILQEICGSDASQP